MSKYIEKNSKLYIYFTFGAIIAAAKIFICALSVCQNLDLEEHDSSVVKSKDLLPDCLHRFDDGAAVGILLAFVD